MFPFQDHRDQACGLQVKNPSLRGGTHTAREEGRATVQNLGFSNMNRQWERRYGKENGENGTIFKIKRRHSKSRNVFLFEYPQSYLCIWQTASMYILHVLIKSFLYMRFSILFFVVVVHSYIL